MTIYDISVPISESLAVWPGDPGIRITHTSHLDRGDMVTVSRLDLGAHTGTHVDAPAHFIQGGQTVDGLDLEVLTGPALVVHAPEADTLSVEILEGLDIPAGAERVLFRTRNSDYWAHSSQTFHQDFCAINDEGARWLVDRGVRLVGVDYLSIGAFADPAPAHRTLLGAGVIAVEGLNLSNVAPGVYQLVCLPIKIAGGEGAPARVILVDPN